MIAQTVTPKQAYRAAYLAALVDAASPFIVGIIHAEKGEICDPSDLYSHDGDIAEFTEGYRSVAAPATFGLDGAPLPSSPRMLAVGRINGGERATTARSLFDANETVEHTVNAWREGEVMAEVRVNGRLLYRRAFSGDNARAEAAAWCDGVAPLADTLRPMPAQVSVPLRVPADFAEDDEAVIAAIFGRVADEDEYSIEDDADWIRQGC